jgi:hypothetical protein
MTIKKNNIKTTTGGEMNSNNIFLPFSNRMTNNEEEE